MKIKQTHLQVVVPIEITPCASRHMPAVYAEFRDWTYVISEYQASLRAPAAIVDAVRAAVDWSAPCES